MATSPAESVPRLTSLSHGGGCGCKIAPGVLSELLRGSGTVPPIAALLVGRDTGDDAAVYRLNDDQAIVATTDFFMPIVDDPFDYGRIAATNALSDVYAMGGTPLFALAIVGMPLKVLPPGVIREILAGGEAVCRSVGIPIAGGHSIDSVEPIYGLVAIGLVAPRDIKRNSAAMAGDLLVLGKPLGVGILSAALKKGWLDAAGYQLLVDTTTQLNLAGPSLARLPGVNAMTDVTGFGLLGHLLGVCRGSGVAATIKDCAVPLLPGALAYAERGAITGASARNWVSYGGEVRLSDGVSDVRRALLCDPQTSGGLLVSCTEAVVPAVLEEFARHGCAAATVIGRLTAGDPAVVVR
ncbi:MAG TPA: selenide, water dikinase SelD [Steroidobacteraceae bacterium]|nr:selenide, water dikinase SelD [Steroidobacteraceae bacterium]